MKQIAGIWLPDHETHLEPYLLSGPKVDGRGTYQKHKYDAALALIPKERRRLALDVGAHVGTWSRLMALDFERVAAFEPVPEHCECWEMNVTAGNARLERCALGDKPGRINVEVTGGHSGHSMTRSGGHIPIARLDVVLEDEPDFIKIDCEGYELFVVRGAERTIREDCPVIVVEQKPGMGAAYGVGDTAAVDLLKSWGARVAWEVGGDFCLVWD